MTSPNTMAEGVTISTRRGGWVVGLLALALASVVLRCISAFDPFPHWSGDPLVAPAPVLGLTPAWASLLDGLVLAAALLAWLLTARASSVWAWWGVVPAAVGAVTLWHARPYQPSQVETMLLGLHWAGGLLLGLAVFQSLRVASLMRPVTLLAGSVVLGCVLMMLVKGVVQVFVEHPQMLRSFRANQDTILRSQGWEPGSVMARGYIRRLEQPEATGWFGLANVFATFAAAGLAVCAGMLSWLWRGSVEARSRALVATWASGAVLCGVGVVLAGSKGGYAAAALGLGLAGAVALVRGRDLGRWAGWVGPGLVVGVLAAVMVRGVIGERMSELSLLFRWYYMQAAGRMLVEHPVAGVGPAQFKDAYMLVKNPLSPEDTIFPHSVLLDWTSTLGVGGALAAGLWMWWLWRSGRGLIAAPQTRSSAQDQAIAESGLLRHARSAALLALIVPSGVAAVLERTGATPETSLARAAGLGLAGVASWAMLRVLESAGGTRAVGSALACGAIVACVHSQIELTGVTAGAMVLAVVLLGCAAGLAPQHVRSERARDHPLNRIARVGCAGAIMLLIGTTFLNARRCLQWERALMRALEPVAQVQELSQRAQALGTGRAVPGFERDSPAAVASDVSAFLNVQIAPTPDALTSGVRRAMLRAMDDALPHLEAARDANVSHFGTLRSLTRVAMARAQMSPGSESDLAALAIDWMRAGGETFHNTALYWSWLGTLANEQAAGQPVSTEAWAMADAAWQRAYALSPHDPLHAVKLSDLAQARGDSAAASRWAGVALAADRQLRLDPVRQLTDSERVRLERR